MAEQVDAADLKSVGSNPVPVRFRPSAPFILLENQALKLKARAEKLSPLIFLNPSKTSTYIFALQKATLGEFCIERQSLEKDIGVLREHILVLYK